jgi:hypothetical protein
MAFPIGEYLILLLDKWLDKHPMENDIILLWRTVFERKFGKLKEIRSLEV